MEEYLSQFAQESAARGRGAARLCIAARAAGSTAVSLALMAIMLLVALA